MSYLEIILPFGIPHPPLAKELLRQMNAPSLAKLLSYGKHHRSLQLNEFARLLPHEFWLYHADPALTSSTEQEERHNSPATTHNTMQERGLEPEAGFWFTLSPVHVHIARDHLVMTDPQRLTISEGESRALFAIALDSCDSMGHQLIYGDAKTWFLRADDWQTLRTSSLQAASGHNMDIWMPEGETARAWRKLQNEIQMAWHISAVNEAREAQGQNTVNSVWIHSGSAAPHPRTFAVGIDALREHLRNAKTAGKPSRYLIDTLSETALNSDWGSWLAQMNALETSCFAPLLQALENGSVTELTFVLSDTQQLAYFRCRKPYFWQRWQKPNFQALLNLTKSQTTSS